jgi:hypothetical protein
LAAETIYYYEVQSTDSSGNTGTDDDSGNYYTFMTIAAPTGITVVSISPDTVTNADATFPVSITGTGFAPGAEVTFENGNGPAPQATVTSVSATGITTTVTMKSGGPPRERKWDVRVTNPDSTSDVLEGSFTVIP